MKLRLTSVAAAALLLASIGFAGGVVLLMTGLVTQLVLVSVLGFVLMLASAFFAVTSYRAVTTAAQLGVVDPSGVRRPPQSAGAGSGRRQRHQSSGGFMARMEERWNRRRDENGRLTYECIESRCCFRLARVMRQAGWATPVHSEAMRAPHSPRGARAVAGQSGTHRALLAADIPRSPPSLGLR